MSRSNPVGVAVVGPFPPRPGGVSVQCATLAAQLAAAGLSVTRINTDLPAWRHGWRRRLFPLAQVLALAWRIRRSRQRWQVMHVHAASWWGFMPAVVALPAVGRGSRRVLSYHGGEAPAFLARWGWLARPVLRRYDAVLALTSTQARLFAAHGIPTRIVPNIVPVERFPFRRRSRLRPRLVWVRQFEPVYRPLDALEVLAQVQTHHPEATLTMVGDGSLLPALRRAVADRNLHGVTLPGRLPPEALPAVYDEADLFLNTSSVDNLPLSLIEAAACGLPIVSTAAGAIPDLIADGENGLLAPVGDVAALAAAILRLLADPTLAASLSAAGRPTAERFTWSAIAPALFAAYGLG